MKLSRKNAQKHKVICRIFVLLNGSARDFDAIAGLKFGIFRPRLI